MAPFFQANMPTKNYQIVGKRSSEGKGGFWSYVCDGVSNLISFKTNNFIRYQMSRLSNRNFDFLVGDCVSNKLICKLLVDSPNPDFEARDKLICCIIYKSCATKPASFSKEQSRDIMEIENHPWNIHVHRALSEYQSGSHIMQMNFMEYLSKKNTEHLITLKNNENLNKIIEEIRNRSDKIKRTLGLIYAESEDQEPLKNYF